MTRDEQIRHRLFQLMTDKTWSKAKVSQITGLSPSTIGKYLGGGLNLKDSTLRDIAYHLQIDADWLLEGIGTPDLKETNSGAKNTEGTNPWENEAYQNLKKENEFLRTQFERLSRLMDNLINGGGKLLPLEIAETFEGSFQGAMAA